MDKKDLFYKDIEGKLEEIKQGKVKKEKPSLGQQLNKAFAIILGLVIIIGLLITLIGVLRR